MNFGNPERPEIMGQFVGSIRGMAEACRVLDYPVVSGNVSLYNETNGVGHPAHAGHRRRGPGPGHRSHRRHRLKREGDLLVVIGREAAGSASRSISRSFRDKLEGAPPPVDLADEIKAGRLIRALIRESKVSAVHDISDGGLLVGLAEMALAGEHRRRAVPLRGEAAGTCDLVRRGPGPLCVAVEPARAEEVLERAPLLALPARIIGRTGGTRLRSGRSPAPLAELRTAHENWLPNYMSHEL